MFPSNVRLEDYQVVAMEAKDCLLLCNMNLSRWLSAYVMVNSPVRLGHWEAFICEGSTWALNGSAQPTVISDHPDCELWCPFDTSLPIHNSMPLHGLLFPQGKLSSSETPLLSCIKSYHPSCWAWDWLPVALAYRPSSDLCTPFTISDWGHFALFHWVITETAANFFQCCPLITLLCPLCTQTLIKHPFIAHLAPQPQIILLKPLAPFWGHLNVSFEVKGH